jgi:hypothetical protein
LTFNAVVVVALALQASSSRCHLLAIVVTLLAIQATLNCCDGDGDGNAMDNGADEGFYLIT